MLDKNIELFFFIYFYYFIWLKNKRNFVNKINGFVKKYME